MHVKRHVAGVAYVKKGLELDLIFEMADSALIIDVHVVSEQTNPEEANRRKISKYDMVELNNIVRRRYRKHQVTKVAVAIGMQKIWSRSLAVAVALWERKIINCLDI